MLHYADKCIVNIMKLYIERNNLQVELIRFRKNVEFVQSDGFNVIMPTECKSLGFEHKPLGSVSESPRRLRRSVLGDANS